MADKKQRYIPVGKKLIPVSEETYLYHTRWVANERYSCLSGAFFTEHLTIDYS